MSTFSTMDLIRPPGVMWLVRERLKQHRERFGGRAPAMLVMHTGSLRSLFEEFADEKGIDRASLPRIEDVPFGAFEGVNLLHCRCGQNPAVDLLVTCESEKEDL